MLVSLFEFLHSVVAKFLDVSDERTATIFWVTEFVKVDTVQKHKTRQIILWEDESGHLKTYTTFSFKFQKLLKKRCNLQSCAVESAPESYLV